MNKRIAIFLFIFIILFSLIPHAVIASSGDKVDILKIEEGIQKIKDVNHFIKMIGLFLFILGLIKKLLKLAGFGVIVYIVLTFINQNPELLVKIQQLIS